MDEGFREGASRALANSITPLMHHSSCALASSGMPEQAASARCFALLSKHRLKERPLHRVTGKEGL